MRIKWLGYLVAFLMLCIVAVNSNELITIVASVFTILSLTWIGISEDKLVVKDLTDNLTKALDTGEDFEIKKAYRNLSILGVNKARADELIEIRKKETI